MATMQEGRRVDEPARKRCRSPCARTALLQRLHGSARSRDPWRLRSRQDGADARDRSPDCAAPGADGLRNGGTVSVVGVYGGFIDKFRWAPSSTVRWTLKSGQTPVQRYMRPLLQRIEAGEIDPSFVITHRMSLSDAPSAYQVFLEKQEERMNVVLTP